MTPSTLTVSVNVIFSDDESSQMAPFFLFNHCMLTILQFGLFVDKRVSSSAIVAFRETGEMTPN